MEGLEGVDKVTDFGQVQELRLNTGADSQRIIREIMSRTQVHSFERTRPTLNDIFLRIAGPEAREAVNA